MPGDGIPRQVPVWLARLEPGSSVIAEGLSMVGHRPAGEVAPERCTPVFMYAWLS
jgi:hypothetical protein